jgi:hypothetical protein
MAQNEDIEYTISDFATEAVIKNDPDQPNKSVLLDVAQYLQDCIDTDKTINALDLSKDAPLSLEQQVFIAKRDNSRLVAALEFVNNKLKELV